MRGTNAELIQALNDLEPKIKKSLRYTDPQNREDLEQELKVKMTECLRKGVFKNPPGFWEFAKRIK